MSVNNATRSIAAGFQRLDFTRVGSNGLPTGLTATVTPGAIGARCGRISAAKTLAITTPAGEVVPVTGDNILQGTFQFQNVSVRAFDLSFAEDDFADRTSFQGINPIAIGNHEFAGRDIGPFVLNDIMLIGVSNARIKTNDASSGLGIYSGVFTTRAQLTARGADNFVERAARTFLATVNLDPMNAYPWGQTFKTGTGNEGYLTSFVQDWTNPYPVTVHRWTQTSGLTKFYLGEQPASTSLDDVLVFVIDTNGTWSRKTTGVTISQADNSLTFSPAPTDAYDIVAWYGYIPS